MKKKYLNTFMTIVSAIYLVFFIVVLIKSKITNNQFDFLDPEIKIQFEETPYDPVKQIPKGRHYNAKFMIKTE